MTPTIDLGKAVGFPTSDPDWLKKCAVAGLILCIPLVGAIAVLGWQKRVMQSALLTNEIPPIAFGEDLAAGFRVFLGVLFVTFPAMLVMFAVQCMSAIPNIAIGNIENEGVRSALTMVAILANLAGMAVFMAMILAINVFMPELLRRILRGEMTPLFSIGRSLSAIKRAPSAYFLAFVGLFLANLVGSLGIYACFVGVILTYPLGLLMGAHILAQWDRIVQGATDLAPSASL